MRLAVSGAAAIDKKVAEGFNDLGITLKIIFMLIFIIFLVLGIVELIFNFKGNNKLININQASIEDLKTLNGIGESKAKSIIEYREQNTFTSIEDIMKVSGISESVFNKIKDDITV